MKAQSQTDQNHQMCGAVLCEEERKERRKEGMKEGMKEARMEGTSCAACLTLAKMIFLGSLSVSHIISDENDIMCTMAFSPPAPIRI